MSSQYFARMLSGVLVIAVVLILCFLATFEDNMFAFVLPEMDMI
jgi:hypothetical protein